MVAPEPEKAIDNWYQTNNDMAAKDAEIAELKQYLSDAVDDVRKKNIAIFKLMEAGETLYDRLACSDTDHAMLSR